MIWICASTIEGRFCGIHTLHLLSNCHCQRLRAHSPVCVSLNHQWKHLGRPTSFSSAALVDGDYFVTAGHNTADYPTSNIFGVEVGCGTLDVKTQSGHIYFDRESLKDASKVPAYRWTIFTGKKSFLHDYAFIDLDQVLYDGKGFFILKAVVYSRGKG